VYRHVELGGDLCRREVGREVAEHPCLAVGEGLGQELRFAVGWRANSGSSLAPARQYRRGREISRGPSLFVAAGDSLDPVQSGKIYHSSHPSLLTTADVG